MRTIATELREVIHGEEAIVAIAAQSLLWYVEEGRSVHDVGKEAVLAPRLVEATDREEEELLREPPEEIARIRRHTLVQLMRPYRDVQFRQRVMDAYGHRCAVCGTALRLVDAAHIVPVTEADGSDSVSNGIALCRLHHGAYDTSLLGVQGSYRVIVNRDAAHHLREVGFDSGLDLFCAALPDAIATPTVAAARPHPRNLRRGLEVRRWPSDLIA